MLGPDAELGEKGARALEINPRDAGKATEHTVDIGVGALPILETILPTDERVRGSTARHRHFRPAAVVLDGAFFAYYR